MPERKRGSKSLRSVLANQDTISTLTVGMPFVFYKVTVIDVSQAFHLIMSSFQAGMIFGKYLHNKRNKDLYKRQILLVICPEDFIQQLCCCVLQLIFL